MSTSTQYQPYYPNGTYRITIEDTKLFVTIERDLIKRVRAAHCADPLPITVRDGALGVELSQNWVPLRWVWRLIGASFGSAT